MKLYKLSYNTLNLIKKIKFPQGKFPGGHVIKTAQKLMELTNFGNMYLLYAGNLPSDDRIYQFLCLSSEANSFMQKLIFFRG